MKKAIVKIEVLDDGQRLVCMTDTSGEMYFIIIGLVNAIRELEEEVSEENRGDYRARILEMLNDRF